MTRLTGLMTGLLIVVTGSAAPEAAPALRAQAGEGAHRALAAMATRQWSGGWANGWNVDGRLVFGEHNPIPQLGLTIQPPATPEIALVYLRAARVLDHAGSLHHARMAKHALLALQTPEGGFPHEGVPSGRMPRSATLDDDTTTGALRFFLAYARATDSPVAWAAVRSTGAFLLAAQYAESGGWPQVYPIRPTAYSRHITFNDGVMANALRACLQLHEALEDPRYLDAAIRAGDCIIALQGGPGEAVWAHQHDPETLAPAPARAFEPAAYTAGESRGVLEVLIDLYLATGETRFLEPFPRALDWYEARRLPNGLWARFYEPGTHRPIYGDRDGQVYYQLEEISEERRTGYSWQGNYYPERAARDYQFIQEHGRDALIERRATPATPNLEALRTNAREVLEGLDETGWWIERPGARHRALLEQQEIPEEAWGVVWSQRFVRNMTTLLDYLEAEDGA